ncbi:unnamed protein product [Calicophoron daubneyi]|uniref:EF-hand domain-containing protein n=1 Tax=Calicophoron daubneyi TaxID=300641 RepID=A0AAV2T3D8_CALDB
MAENPPDASGFKVKKNKGGSKSEKILAKLERLTKKDDRVLDLKIDECISTWEDYERFVALVEKWYNKNAKRYMRHMAQYGRDIISEIEFKVVMRDLGVPFSEVQLHMLYLWLDPNRTGMVEYAKLFESLYRALYRRYLRQDEKTTMNLEYQKKWINMTFKSPTCDILEMPTTFEALVHLGYTGAMLGDLISARVPMLATRSFIIFTDPARYSETLVRCNQKLYDFPYVGGPKCAPKEGTIYYEFSVGHIDCPLLLDVRVKGREKTKPQELPGQADTTSPTGNRTTSSD